MQVESQEKPFYSLDELLAQCEPPGEMSDEEREWITPLPAGEEIL